MRIDRNIVAALCALSSTAMFSLIDSFVVTVSQEAGLWQFQLVRAIFAIPMLLGLALVFRQRILPAKPTRALLRTLATALGLLIYFAALGTFTVAQAGAGLFSAPIWVMLFSALVFGYRIIPAQIFAVLVGFAGVVILLRPDFNNLTIASVLPMFAGVLYGLGMLLTRVWCHQESALCLAILIFLTIGAISALVLVAQIFTGTGEGFLLRGWESMTTDFLWLTFLQAGGAVLAVPAISQAYRIGAPALISILEYSFLIFAGIWAYLIWGIPTTAAALAGIILIIASGAVMALKSPKQPSDIPASRP